MAIVFISPGAKQRVFFRAIIILIMLVLAVAVLVFFITGLANRNQVMSQKTSINDLNVAINFNVMDSSKVKNLEPFYNLETEFTYVVTDRFGKKIQGNISAGSQDMARALLEGSDFKVVSLQEVVAGNSDPFVSY